MRKTLPLWPLLGAVVALACTVSLFGTPTATAVPTTPVSPSTSAPSAAPPHTSTPPAAPTSTLTPASAPPATQPAGSGAVTPGAPSGPYAVILVSSGDVLNIRSGAGAGYSIVGSFPPTATGVMRTGPSARSKARARAIKAAEASSIRRC